MVFPLEEYKNSRTKIKCLCLIDGNVWYTTSKRLFQGCGCPECGERKRVKKIKDTNETFIKKLKVKKPYLILLSEYKDRKTPIKVKCSICGHIWECLPPNLMSSRNCPNCAIINKSKTHKQFEQEIKNINPYIKLNSEYINTTTKIETECLICGHIWYPQARNILSGRGCPHCATSKGEKKIKEVLNKYDKQYVYNSEYFNDLYGIGGRLLRPDFILPKEKIWIEFNGQQHEKPISFGEKNKEKVIKSFYTLQKNDKIKDEYAKSNNWKLIKIWYYDFNNIEKILIKELNLKVK